jgi:hypothetical protein
MICQYCNKEAIWVENKEVYGHNYGKSYMIWLCKGCDAYVGCHNNTQKPLGMLANKELRLARKTAKDLFIKQKIGDWHAVKNNVKNEAYKWLAEQLGLEKKYTHFGMFDLKTCNKVIELCK